ncbi:Eco57I restriction-modification methylase domain-containing protein [Olegusella massiliensis]|uniref:Eco57I restriction-modification methylase domain-containing protein n=1 Tax=Olegusella massiliensis TaxID=1776381 RepID=UPI0023F788F7|nr:Eco57I restriction-modification methylase domain-containing protein [Olegusella massiliensis]
MTEPIHDISVEGFIESFDCRYPTFILKTLLCDRTTGRNIIWADNEYEVLGDGYMGDDEITVEKITGMNSGVIKPRIAKEQEKQSQRTKSRAEVFTPSWLCNQMNNDLDEAWFGRRDVFNVEIDTEDGHKTWTATNDPIAFPKSKGRGWHAYIEAPQLEITCGEAPFVCSRYDTVTGDELPVRERVGFLDRKLRVVTEKTKTRKEWVRRALDALRATYGFEYQGDNLLIARLNVFETFVEHLRDRWGSDAVQEELEQAAWIVSWNFWQMDGRTDAVPTNKMGAEVESTLGTFEEPELEPIQPSLFDLFNDVFTDETTETTQKEELKETVPLCVIYDWKSGEPFEFASLKGKVNTMGKKFYAVIGNPPYQEENSDNNRQAPIYPAFMDSSYAIAKRVELITPARFLFDAGQTAKAWNKKMLNDEHLSVMAYSADGTSYFPGTDIKGGIAVTYHDTTKVLGPIGTFTSFPKLNSIVNRVHNYVNARGGSYMNSIVAPRGNYRFTPEFIVDYPVVVHNLGKGTGNMFGSNVFNGSAGQFFEQPFQNAYRFLCRIDGKRSYRYVDRKYVQPNDFAEKFNVAISQANGRGAFGEALSTPELLSSGDCTTDTYLSVGRFDTTTETENLAKYIKSKFARSLLGVKKVTQNTPPAVWAHVPLQDFTSDSDIDWSQSVADIDRQLYAKYGLNDEEIEFIETHVKEMD